MTTSKNSTLPLFLAGLGTGIAMTLLLAPHSGAATRRFIGRKVKLGEDWVRDSTAHLRDQAMEAVDTEAATSNHQSY